MTYSKKVYSLLAYDKKNDIYDVITSSDDYDKIFDLAQILQSMLHTGRLLSKDYQEPYDHFVIYNNEDCEHLDII